LQGANSYGQLASGHCEDTFKPEEVQIELGNIRSISGGGGHTLIILGMMIG
jgi:alpha-tubulin suppressor-like RCC1 family protein